MSIFAIVLMGKRELVALLCPSFWCIMIVVWLFLAMTRVCLQFVLMVFPDYTHHFLFNIKCLSSRQTGYRLNHIKWNTMARQRNVIQMAFRWLADSGPIIYDDWVYFRWDFLVATQRTQRIKRFVLCASVYMCFVVTCWETADLLALVCGVFCEFVTFPLVSWVRCGT